MDKPTKLILTDGGMIISYDERIHGDNFDYVRADKYQEALEKARKFDQIVEARKKATPGEWMPGKFQDTGFANQMSIDPSIATAYGCQEEVASNVGFITLAANLTRKDTK